MSKDYEIKINRMNRKLKQFIKIQNLTFSKLTKKDVEKFILENFNTTNRLSHYNNIRILNDLLEYHKVPITIDSSEYVDISAPVKDERYFTKVEIQETCDAIINFQDKFILYALFNGIRGKGCSDLLNIKVEDIAEDNSYINLPDGRFICDDYMKNLLRGCKKATSYRKYINAETADTIRSKDTYDFNMDSPYLIKIMPTSRNDYGMKAMTLATLNARLEKIEKGFNEDSEDKILLTTLSLETSGVLYEMFLQEVENSKSWDIKEIDNFIKMNGYRKNANEIYRIYHNRYHDSNKNVF